MSLELVDGPSSTSAAAAAAAALAAVQPEDIAEALRAAAQAGAAGSQLASRLEAAQVVLRSFTRAVTESSQDASCAGMLARVFVAADSIEPAPSDMCPGVLESMVVPGTAVAARFDLTMLDVERVTHAAPGERNFHIFYELCAGLSSTEAAKLYLPDLAAGSGRVLVRGRPADHPAGAQADVRSFDDLRGAMSALGIGDREQATLFRVVAAILALGDVAFSAATEAGQLPAPGFLCPQAAATVVVSEPALLSSDHAPTSVSLLAPLAATPTLAGVSDSEYRRAMMLHASARRFLEAAQLLEVPADMLAAALTRKSLATATSASTSSAAAASSVSATSVPIAVAVAEERRDRLCRSLYAALVDLVVARINSTIGADHPAILPHVAALAGDSSTSAASAAATAAGADPADATLGFILRSALSRLGPSSAEADSDLRAGGKAVLAASDRIRTVAVVDTPGFGTRRIPPEFRPPDDATLHSDGWTAGGGSGMGRNGLWRLLANTACEQLEAAFAGSCVEARAELLRHELIARDSTGDYDPNFHTNAELLTVLDQPPLGVLPQIDEGSRYPRFEDRALVTKLLSTHSRRGKIAALAAPMEFLLESTMVDDYVSAERELLSTYGSAILPAGATPAAEMDRARTSATSQLQLMFAVRHTQGEVSYDARGVLIANRGATAPASLCQLLARGSGNTIMRVLGRVMRAHTATHDDAASSDGGGRASEPDASLEGSSALRCTQSLIKMARIMDLATTRSAEPLFVRCIVPNHLNDPRSFETKAVAFQVRTQNLVPLLRVAQNGFSLSMAFRDFYDQFIMALPNRKGLRLTIRDIGTDSLARDQCDQLLAALWRAYPSNLGIYDRSREVSLGRTRVFIRRDAAVVLEAARRGQSARMDASASRIQNWFRGRTGRSQFVRAREALRRVQAAYRARPHRRAMHEARMAASRIKATFRAMLAARRFARLKGAVTKLQARMRGRASRNRFEVAKATLRRLQALTAGHLLRNQLLAQYDAALQIQRVSRKYLRRSRQYWSAVHGALLLQSLWRGYQWRRDHRHLILYMRKRVVARLAVVRLARLQAMVRGRSIHGVYLRMRAAAVRIQRWIRSCLLFRGLHVMRAAARVIQRMVRHSLFRRRLRETRERRMLAEHVWRTKHAREQESDQLVHHLRRVARLNASKHRRLRERLEEARRAEATRDKWGREFAGFAGVLHERDKEHVAHEHYLARDTMIVDVDANTSVDHSFPGGWTKGVSDLDAALRERGQRIDAIAIGSHHAVALSSEGHVYTWGLNDRSQLGHGYTRKRITMTDDEIRAVRKAAAFRPGKHADTSAARRNRRNSAKGASSIRPGYTQTTAARAVAVGQTVGTPLALISEAHGEEEDEESSRFRFDEDDEDEFDDIEEFDGTDSMLRPIGEARARGRGRPRSRQRASMRPSDSARLLQRVASSGSVLRGRSESPSAAVPVLSRSVSAPRRASSSLAILDALPRSPSGLGIHGGKGLGGRRASFSSQGSHESRGGRRSVSAPRGGGGSIRGGPGAMRERRESRAAVTRPDSRLEVGHSSLMLGRTGSMRMLAMGVKVAPSASGGSVAPPGNERSSIVSAGGGGGEGGLGSRRPSRIWAVGGTSTARRAPASGAIWDDTASSVGGGWDGAASEVGVSVAEPTILETRVVTVRRHAEGLATPAMVQALRYEPNRPRPPLPYLSMGVRVTAIAAGSDHTLVLTDQGRVMAWGANNRGQLGLGHREPTAEPTEVPGLRGRRVVQVAAGPRFSLVVTQNGGVFTWGAGEHSGHGLSSFLDPTSRFSETAMASAAAAAMARGELVESVLHHNPGARDSSAPVVARGAGSGSLPLPGSPGYMPGNARYGIWREAPREVVAEPVGPTTSADDEVPTAGDSTGIFDSRTSSAADGNAPAPELELPPTRESARYRYEAPDCLSPSQVQSIQRQHVIKAACGWGFTLVLTLQGRVFGWGDNSSGQLGVGSPHRDGHDGCAEFEPLPVLIWPPPTASDLAEVVGDGTGIASHDAMGSSTSAVGAQRRARSGERRGSVSGATSGRATSQTVRLGTTSDLMAADVAARAAGAAKARPSRGRSSVKVSNEARTLEEEIANARARALRRAASPRTRREIEARFDLPMSPSSRSRRVGTDFSAASPALGGNGPSKFGSVGPSTAAAGDGGQESKETAPDVTSALIVSGDAAIPLPPGTMEGDFAGACEDIAVGGLHSVIRTSGGGVWSWGSNRFGQLGLGHFHTVFHPRLVRSLASLPVTSITCGWRHTTAVVEGALVAWGHTSAVPTVTPVPVPPPPPMFETDSQALPEPDGRFYDLTHAVSPVPLESPFRTVHRSATGVVAAFSPTISATLVVYQELLLRHDPRRPPLTAVERTQRKVRALRDAEREMSAVGSGTTRGLVATMLDDAAEDFAAGDGGYDDDLESVPDELRDDLHVLGARRGPLIGFVESHAMRVRTSLPVTPAQAAAALEAGTDVALVAGSVADAKTRARVIAAAANARGLPAGLGSPVAHATVASPTPNSSSASAMAVTSTSKPSASRPTHGPLTGPAAAHVSQGGRRQLGSTAGGTPGGAAPSGMVSLTSSPGVAQGRGLGLRRPTLSFLSADQSVPTGLLPTQSGSAPGGPRPSSATAAVPVASPREASKAIPVIDPAHRMSRSMFAAAAAVSSAQQKQQQAEASGAGSSMDATAATAAAMQARVNQRLDVMAEWMSTLGTVPGLAQRWFAPGLVEYLAKPTGYEKAEAARDRDRLLQESVALTPSGMLHASSVCHRAALARRAAERGLPPHLAALEAARADAAGLMTALAAARSGPTLQTAMSAALGEPRNPPASLDSSILRNFAALRRRALLQARLNSSTSTTSQRAHRSHKQHVMPAVSGLQTLAPEQVVGRDIGSLVSAGVDPVAVERADLDAAVAAASAASTAAGASVDGESGEARGASRRGPAQSAAVAAAGGGRRASAKGARVDSKSAGGALTTTVLPTMLSARAVTLLARRLRVRRVMTRGGSIGPLQRLSLHPARALAAANAWSEPAPDTAEETMRRAELAAIETATVLDVALADAAAAAALRRDVLRYVRSYPGDVTMELWAGTAAPPVASRGAVPPATEAVALDALQGSSSLDLLRMGDSVGLNASGSLALVGSQSGSLGAAARRAQLPQRSARVAAETGRRAGSDSTGVAGHAYGRSMNAGGLQLAPSGDVDLGATGFRIVGHDRHGRAIDRDAEERAEFSLRQAERRVTAERALRSLESQRTREERAVRSADEVAAAGKQGVTMFRALRTYDPTAFPAPHGASGSGEAVGGQQGGHMAAFSQDGGSDEAVIRRNAARLAVSPSPTAAVVASGGTRDSTFFLADAPDPTLVHVRPEDRESTESMTTRARAEAAAVVGAGVARWGVRSHGEALDDVTLRAAELRSYDDGDSSSLTLDQIASGGMAALGASSDGAETTTVLAPAPRIASSPHRAVGISSSSSSSGNAAGSESLVDRGRRIIYDEVARATEHHRIPAAASAATPSTWSAPPPVPLGDLLRDADSDALDGSGGRQFGTSVGPTNRGGSALFYDPYVVGVPVADRSSTAAGSSASRGVARSADAIRDSSPYPLTAARPTGHPLVDRPEYNSYGGRLSEEVAPSGSSGSTQPPPPPPPPGVRRSTPTPQR